MFNWLRVINNIVDEMLHLCDKYLQSGLNEKMKVLQNNCLKGAQDGTVRALKIHANLKILLKIFFKLFLNKSIFHGNNPLKISLERASSLSQSSSPSFSPLLPVEKAKEWK